MFRSMLSHKKSSCPRFDIQCYQLWLQSTMKDSEFTWSMITELTDVCKTLRMAISLWVDYCLGKNNHLAIRIREHVAFDIPFRFLSKLENAVQYIHAWPWEPVATLWESLQGFPSSSAPATQVRLACQRVASLDSAVLRPPSLKLHINLDNAIIFVNHINILPCSMIWWHPKAQTHLVVLQDKPAGTAIPLKEWKHKHWKRLLLKDQFKRIVIEITRGYLPIHVETLKKTLIEEVIHWSLPNGHQCASRRMQKRSHWVNSWEETLAHQARRLSQWDSVAPFPERPTDDNAPEEYHKLSV